MIEFVEYYENIPNDYPTKERIIDMIFSWKTTEVTFFLTSGNPIIIPDNSVIKTYDGFVEVEFPDESRIHIFIDKIEAVIQKPISKRVKE